MPEIPDMSLGQFFLIFVLPVVLGIVTTAVIFIARSYYFDSFLPRQVSEKQKILGTLSLAGTWKAETNPSYDPSRRYIETIHIQHQEQTVRGDIFYREVNTENNQNEEVQLNEKHFEFTGTVVNEVLAATYLNTDARSKGRGTFCLYSTDDDVLEGQFSWYEPSTRQVESGKYVWKRVPE